MKTHTYTFAPGWWSRKKRKPAFALDPCRVSLDRMMTAPIPWNSNRKRLADLWAFKDLPSFFWRNKEEAFSVSQHYFLGTKAGLNIFLQERPSCFSPSHLKGHKVVLWHSQWHLLSVTDLRTLLCHHLEWGEAPENNRWFPLEKAELTQIVVALVHLSDSKFLWLLGESHNSVVAQAGEGMLKHTPACAWQPVLSQPPAPTHLSTTLSGLGSHHSQCSARGGKQDSCSICQESQGWGTGDHEALLWVLNWLCFTYSPAPVDGKFLLPFTQQNFTEHLLWAKDFFSRYVKCTL